MFAQRSHGLLDFTVAALCLWAAVWHTPAGALARSLSARLTNSKASHRPLLAYYSGGLFDAEPPVSTPATPLIQNHVQPLPPQTAHSALARGVWASVNADPLNSREVMNSLAHHFSLPGPTDADSLAQVVSRAHGEFESDDATVLSLFAGYEVTRYALGRTRAAGRPPTLEALSQQLPPSSAAAIRQASHSLMLGTAYSLAWPLAENTVVTSHFGSRESPTSAGRQFHPGIDLRAPEGTQVHAVAEGVVTRASFDSLNGNIVVIDHGHGVKSAYCHNSQLLVKVGDRVRQDDLISLSGNTGRSTAAHLHYQVELSQQPTDPLALRAAAAIVSSR